MLPIRYVGAMDRFQFGGMDKLYSNITIASLKVDVFLVLTLLPLLEKNFLNLRKID